MEYDGLLMLRGKEKEALIREHFKRSAGYLTKIRDLLAARHIPLLIVMYPHGIYVGGDQWGQGRLTWGFEAGKKYTDFLPFEIVEDFAKEQKIPFINVLDDFLKAPGDKYFFDWDGHMTPKGNMIAADAVVRNQNFQRILKEILAKE